MEGQGLVYGSLIVATVIGAALFIIGKGDFLRNTKVGLSLSDPRKMMLTGLFTFFVSLTLLLIMICFFRFLGATAG